MTTSARCHVVVLPAECQGGNCGKFNLVVLTEPGDHLYGILRSDKSFSNIFVKSRQNTPVAWHSDDDNDGRVISRY